VRNKELDLFSVLAVFVLLGIAGSLHSGPTGMQSTDTLASALYPQGGSAPQSPSTPLDNAIDFLKAFGFFNVVLPFLLIFTIVFGVLEKTRIFGTEKFKDQDVPRKNLNSVVAFCIAFFVVAASNVVKMIQVSLPAVALILVVIIIFLLLFGALMGQEDLVGGINLWKHKGFKPFFIIGIMTALAAIFLAGFGILDDIIAYTGTNITGTFATSIILFVIAILAVWFVTNRSGDK